MTANGGGKDQACVCVRVGFTEMVLKRGEIDRTSEELCT